MKDNSVEDEADFRRENPFNTSLGLRPAANRLGSTVMGRGKLPRIG